MVYNQRRRGETRVRVVGRNNITFSHMVAPGGWVKVLLSSCRGRALCAERLTSRVPLCLDGGGARKEAAVLGT